MIVTLDNAYQSELLFLPARHDSGVLKGIEIVVNFVGVHSRVRIPTELVLAYLSPVQELALFHEKLALLETCKLFFIQQQLNAWINISPAIVEYLIMDGKGVSICERYPWLEFSINENYPDLNKGNMNTVLMNFALRFPLVLANFGAGDASTKAIFNGLFNRVALDKNFIQQHLTDNTFDPFLRAIVSQVTPYCQAVMVGGVDDASILQRLSPYQFSAMQGNLWPPVTVDKITSLVQG
ncbi:EAL domain-containing protein [Enterobacteriaceae bacterium H4N4]|uniref:EAL domain-containing protein n=1 Tax=Silvania confinis TaxID=2926470 RepID=A0A9J6QLT3_9ENTR|nr:EAL domain-containing protein [Silvania confinis]MCU6671267.1 EAL domain-containing protein [Silvania confinis]